MHFYYVLFMPDYIAIIDMVAAVGDAEVLKRVLKLFQTFTNTLNGQSRRYGTGRDWKLYPPITFNCRRQPKNRTAFAVSRNNAIVMALWLCIERRRRWLQDLLARVGECNSSGERIFTAESSACMRAATEKSLRWLLVQLWVTRDGR